MTTADSLKKQILTYFGTIASPARGSLTIRDFNTQLMSKTFAAEDRDLLAVALDELVASGLLVERSAKTYALTPQGVAAAHEAKAAKASEIASKR